LSDVLRLVSDKENSMNGMLMDGRIGKLWLCKKNGHALGIVVMDKTFVDRLLLFRAAVVVDEPYITGTVALVSVKVIGEPEGTMRDIECDICGARRTWWIDAKRVAILLFPLYGKV
jgi:hypothetical protein